MSMSQYCERSRKNVPGAISLDHIPRRLSDLWNVDDIGKAKVINDAYFRTRVLEINKTGALIWSLCDGEHTVRDIIAGLEAALSDEESIDHEQLVEDVRRFLGDLETERLIEWISS